MPFLIRLAQIHPVLGELDRNLELHRACLEEASADGADLVIFPELSLTGYFVKDLAGDLGITAKDPRLDLFRAASAKLDIVVSLILSDSGQLQHIAALYFSEGEIR
ncbi:MAG: carbon-nitrogen hydrolase, partial [Cyanobacteria bacterium REEB65]|nr:carbon-nitrogen hydrolase [Cyanobacteria bacterium REEB65]